MRWASSPAHTRSARESQASENPADRTRSTLSGALMPISWEQALSEIGGRLKRLRADHGGDAIGLYLGNPISMSFLPPLLSTAFVKAFGSSKLYHTGSQDCNNKFVAAERMYGSAQIQPFPDIDHSRFIIAIGSNPALGPAAVQRLVDLLHGHGLTVKVSSIHVNAWFGSYDKLTMTRRLMHEQFGIDLEAERDRLAFVGDSPNDEPMFRFFPNSIAVANIADFAATIEHKPTYVTRRAEGDGFAELARLIVARRRRAG